MSLINNIKNKAKNWLISIGIKKGITNIENKAKAWLISIGIKKGITRVAIWLASFFSAHQIAIAITVNGQSFDTTQNGITAGLIFVLEILRNWLKTKYPNKFGWL